MDRTGYLGSGGRDPRGKSRSVSFQGNCFSAQCIYLSEQALLCVTGQNCHGLLQQADLQNNKQDFCMCDCSKYLLMVTAVFLSEVLPALINSGLF